MTFLATPSGADRDRRFRQRSRIALLAQHYFDSFVGKSVSRQLELEVHDVIDEHDVVDQQVADRQVAIRPFIAQRHGHQRYAATAGVFGRVGQ